VAIAMTEADAGSDLASIRTARCSRARIRAERQQMFITNSVMRIFTSWRRAQCGGEGDPRLSLFLVDEARPFRVDAGSKKWAGGRPIPRSCLRRLPHSGDGSSGHQDRGFYALMKNVQNERLVLSAQAMGRRSRRSR
jgi:acyl-CoA dehydrogenase